MSEWQCRKSWKYPTDRELALRAKVNAGWSIHTDNVFLKPDDFDLKELQAISRVIQRANDLERLEVERVGKMVYKLDNMSRYALGDGKKTCSMCCTTFGIFRSSYIKCVDCGKAVCEKCRVDTLTASLDICMLCKICSENREVWKKSGGWFYGKLPTMTEACQQECVKQTSASPSLARAFDTWSHRAPDIVRLESYEPPEENHNDHSLYTSWTISPTTDKTDTISLGNSDLSDEDQNDHFQHKDLAVNLVPDIHYSKSLEQLEEKNNDVPQDEDFKMNSSIPDIRYNKSMELLEEKNNDVPQHEDFKMNSSIPDIHALRDRNTPPPFIELESFRSSVGQKKQNSNFLSVLSAKLSTSCPTLTDIQEPSRLRRKLSIRRRKRTSAPTRGKLQDK